MREWVKSVTSGTVAGVLALVLAPIFTGGEVRLSIWIVNTLPVVGIAAVAGATSIGLLAASRWLRKHVLKTRKERRFRKLHPLVTDIRDRLPLSPPDSAMITNDIRKRYLAMETDVADDAVALDGKLEKLDVHMRLSTREKWEWQRSFRDLAEHSRTGDLKAARARFLD